MPRVLAPAIAFAVLAAASVAAHAQGPTAAPSPVLVPAPADGRCASLADLRLKQGEIVSARLQPAGAPVAGAVPMSMPGRRPPEVSGLPAFCRVMGRLHPERGSDIRFEVWLPAGGWDGRLTGVGNGGLAGTISYGELAAAVRGGHAGVSTDTGHQAVDGDEAGWAKGRPERIRDYGWRGIHVSTLAAKAVIAGYYGRRPDRSYFIGCSNGGRQGLMEAARFPGDYDGVLAGAPAAAFTDIAMSRIWAYQAQSPPRAAIRPEQMRRLQSEVVRQCDALDGQVDGLVADPRACRLDVSKLTCDPQASPQCFTAPQLAALERIQAGARDAAGRQIAPGLWPAGAEVGMPFPMFGWDGLIAADPKALPFDPMLTDMVARPFATTETFDFNRDPERLKAALGGELDVSPDLRRFFARGGKLILWQGWADPAVPPVATLAYHQAVLARSGPRAKDQTRLFMVPGVQHCLGGPGPDVFGQWTPPPADDPPERNIATALIAWVETDRVPDAVAAGRTTAGGSPFGARGKPGKRERLLCAYPARAELRPGADPDQAASYVCRT